MAESEVEVNVRVPRVKTPLLDNNGYPIDNGSVRFIKRVTVPALPKPGEMLILPTKDGKALECEVTRADWNDDKGLFVVYCRYSKRSIPTDEYHALMGATDWEMRPLL